MPRYLPRAMAESAPPNWNVDRSSAYPRISGERMGLLVFGILRELLNPKILAQIYLIEDGEPVPRQGRPDECMLSVRGGKPRVVGRTGLYRRGRGTDSEGAQFRKENNLARLVLPHWVCGTRLKFQTDRWCVAPPKWTKEISRLEKLITDLPRDEGRLRARKQLLQELRPLKRPTFTAVSRLICFDRHGHPKVTGGFGRAQTREIMAVHHACSVCRASRARCLNVEHICWGLARDNTYHRVIRHLYNGPVRQGRHARISVISKSCIATLDT